MSAQSMNFLSVSPPILYQGNVPKSSVRESPYGLHELVDVCPQGMDSATSSSLTDLDAASNAACPGNSEFTFHPPPNQPKSEWARLTAACRSWSKQTGTCPTRGLPPPPPIESVDQLGLGIDSDHDVGVFSGETA